MIEDIKFALDIENDKYDKKIAYYIRKVSKRILNYCNIESVLETPSIFDELIESKVTGLIENLLSTEETSTDAVNQELLKNQGAIKSVSRGDTTITYNYDSISSSQINTDSILDFTSEEKMFLNKHRKLKK